jgi:hypothetical protein
MIPGSSTYVTQFLCSEELYEGNFDTPMIYKDLNLLAANRKYRFDGKKLLRK